jgi:hypothetical protein
MRVKVRPVRGTTLHVWNRAKYYPGEIKEVDDELGAVLISQRIVDEIEVPKPPKRSPGRPRRIFSND